MNATTLRAWLGQVTTGVGALIATPTAIALLTHQITVEQAIPPLLAALVGFLWPENKQLPANVQTAATDIEALIPQLLTAYRTGLQHGASVQAALPASVAASTTNGGIRP